MRLSEDVIRYLTVKQDGPLPAPAALPPAQLNPLPPNPPRSEITARQPPQACFRRGWA